VTDKVRVNPFNNVGASSLAQTTYKPVSRQSSLFGFVLTLGGTTFTEAHINHVRVKAPGGKDLIPPISGARLRDMFEYEGGSWPAGQDHVPILFGDPFALTKAGRHLGNFDHSVYPGDMLVEVDIGAATAPTLEAHALVDPPKAQMGLGYTAGEVLLHRALRETVLTPNAAVSNQSVQIGIGSSAGALLKRLHFFHTNLTALRVKKEGLEIFEEISISLNEFIQQDVFARVPQAGLYVYDRVEDGSMREAGTTLGANGQVLNWQFDITTSAGDTITTYADLLATLPQL